MADDWQWPGGAKAAVSLSYDDGNGNNLDQAIPDLEKAGFRGTFYLTISRGDMRARVAEWKAAFERGHEIGNHTLNHRCRAEPYLRSGKPVPAWLDVPLESLTPEMIEEEVSGAAGWINEHIGLDADRTFCHPCGALAIGDPPDEGSYDRAIRRHHFAARTTARVVNDPRTLSFLRIGAFGCSGNDGNALVVPCEKALDTQGWAVLYFHGVGGPSQETTRTAHQAIVSRLQSSDFWVAPVKTVARYIQQRRGLA